MPNLVDLQNLNNTSPPGLPPRKPICRVINGLLPCCSLQNTIRESFFYFTLLRKSYSGLSSSSWRAPETCDGCELNLGTSENLCDTPETRCEDLSLYFNPHPTLTIAAVDTFWESVTAFQVPVAPLGCPIMSNQKPAVYAPGA